jgi:hypothetical protein
LNMEYSLTFMYLDDAKVTAINRFDFAPWLTRLCSAANIGVLIWLLAPFVRGARPGVGARRRESGRTGMGQRLTVLRGDEPA